MLTLWNKIYFIKNNFWKFYIVRSERRDFNWCRFWASWVHRYVLWCCGSRSQEEFTFLQIGSGHTVVSRVAITAGPAVYMGTVETWSYQFFVEKCLKMGKHFLGGIYSLSQPNSKPFHLTWIATGRCWKIRQMYSQKDFLGVVTGSELIRNFSGFF